MSKLGKSPFIELILLICVAGVFGLLFFYFVPSSSTMIYSVETANGLASAMDRVKPEEKVAHLPTPKPLKGIYMTQCVAGTPSLRSALAQLIDETELNSVVIDVKDYSGMISFIPTDESLKDFVSTRCYAPDMKEFIKSLHEKGIYVIGRITVFQDPFYTKRRPDLAVQKASDRTTWHDNKGLSFIDPGAKEFWDYIVRLSEESYALGFDELNYDYIRYPSDGPMKDIYFASSGGRAKADVLEEFFIYLQNKVKPIGAVISADLFGMTTTNEDDLNIGQVLEKTLPYFDYVAPMVYPSHYPPKFNGWSNPNALPYDLIKFVMSRAVERAVGTSSVILAKGGEAIASTSPQLYTKPVFDPLKLRPWLQDFSLGSPPYGAEEVRAQITATYDSGLDSWMLWNAANRYTRNALKSE